MSDIPLNCKRNIKNIIVKWGYTYMVIYREKDPKVKKAWLELYMLKTPPPQKVRDNAKSLADLKDYNLEFVCCAVDGYLHKAYIKLLRRVELINDKVQFLQKHKADSDT